MALYDDLLINLTLSDGDKHLLQQRDFDPQTISLNNYRSLTDLYADDLRDFIKNNNVSNTAGFYKKDKEWMLNACAGIVIPCRDYTGTIKTLKIRTQTQTQQYKYRIISSNPEKFNSGTKAKLHPHWPILKHGNDVLVITEGELKADLVALHWQKTAVGLPGVTQINGIIKELCQQKYGFKKIQIAFDADKKDAKNNYGLSEKYGVGEQCLQLYYALNNKGFNVEILNWERQYGKGIDDVLVNGFADKISVMSDDELQAFANDILPENDIAEYVFVVQTKKFYHQKTLKTLDIQQFNCKFLHLTDKTLPSLHFFKNAHFTTCDELVYEPQAHRRIIDLGEKYTGFNCYRASDVLPQAGDAQFFVGHIELLLGRTEAGILLDFLAFLVQRPGQKLRYAMVVQGAEEGTGKSLIADIMTKILGRDNVGNVNNDMLDSQYNSWGLNKILVVIEEIYTGDNVKTASRLKTLITQDDFMVRDLYNAPFLAKNKFNLLIFTNHQNAIKITDNDRRYCILTTKIMPQKNQYYEELMKKSLEGLPQILYYLRQRDITHVKHYARAPKTIGRDVFIEQGLTNLQFYLKMALEERTHPLSDDIVSCKDVVERLPVRLRPSLRRIKNDLEMLGAKNLGKVRMQQNGKRMQKTLYLLRNFELWSQSSSDNMAIYYQDAQKKYTADVI